MLSLSVYHKREGSRIKESGTEIGNTLEFDFVVPSSAQLSRACKADEISVVEHHSTTASYSTSKIIERLGLLSQPLQIVDISLIFKYHLGCIM